MIISHGRKAMVCFPLAVVDRIDDFAGHTHSSRPDFITDAVRQYTAHVLRGSISHSDRTNCRILRVRRR